MIIEKGHTARPNLYNQYISIYNNTRESELRENPWIWKLCHKLCGQG